MDPTETLQQALAHHGRGELADAARLYREVLESDPSQADALHYLGVTCLQAGQLDEAVKLIDQALAVQPDYVDAMVNLGFGLSAQGRFEDAVAQFKRAIEFGPVTAILHANLAGAQEQLGNHTAAIEHFEKALELQPDMAEARRSLADVLLKAGDVLEARRQIDKAIETGQASPAMQVSRGNILLTAGDIDDAIECFRSVLAAHPGAAPVRASLAKALRRAGDFDTAVEGYERSLADNPDDSDARFELGTIYKELGRSDDAIGQFRAALELNPRSVRAWQGVVSATSSVLDDSDVAALGSLQKDGLQDVDDDILLAFTLGSAFERRGEHDKAAQHYVAGNKKKRATFDYDIDADLRSFENFRRLDKAFFERWNDAGLADNTPIFVVGMPRSGTSLVEQILASHPTVFGAGERILLSNSIIEVFPIGDAHDYTSALSAATAEKLRDAAGRYLSGLPDTEAKRVTDKLPHNFLNIGMIHVMFPNAAIVHCRRDPRDTCFSIFKHLFGAASHFYAYEMDELGRYYNAYSELMRYWDEVLPGVVYTIDYETLVEDQETETRALLAACGLDWDPACLDYHKTDRPVATISAAQVRQPIYRGSVGAWHRYERMLRPLLDVLEPDSDG